MLFLQTSAETVNFFDSTSLFTMGGAISVVILVTDTITHVFGWFKRWFPLVLSVVVSFFICIAEVENKIVTTIREDTVKEKVKKEVPQIVELTLVLVNGFLIYSIAFGIQNNLIKPENDGGDGQLINETDSAPNPSFDEDNKKQRTFRTEW